MAKEIVELDVVAEVDTDKKEVTFRCRTPTRKVESSTAAAMREAEGEIVDLVEEALKAEILALFA